MVQNLYPIITVNRIEDPSRFYAFPLLGFLVKIIMLIPIFIELIFLGIAVFVLVVLINPFVVLFTGKYWDTAYTLLLGVLRLGLKVSYFLFGLTNTYPGFGFAINDSFKLDMPKPTNPNRFFAIPLLGGIARIVLLIPYMMYEGVIRNAAYAGIVGASFPVLFKGYYPESSFELARDGVRLNLTQGVYMAGLSDKYPSFWISMNHKTIKIILIILGVLMFLGNIGNSAMTPKSSSPYQNETFQDYEPTE